MSEYHMHGAYCYVRYDGWDRRFWRVVPVTDSTCVFAAARCVVDDFGVLVRVSP